MSVGTVARTRRRARQGRLRAEATTFVLRKDAETYVSHVGDMHVLYPHLVAGRKIDRAAWADVVERLLTEEAEGNKTAFGAVIGVDRKTVNRWLDQGVDVSDENVRAVARAFHLSAVDLLIRVGYFLPEDLQNRPAQDDVVIQKPDGDVIAIQIKHAKVRPSVKRDLMQYVADKRAQFEAQLAADVERILIAEQRSSRSA
jgi:hypothetical protein